MDGNESLEAIPKQTFSNLYFAGWNVKDPVVRNLYVDPSTLEVRSQYWEHMTIVPILATIMLAVTVLLLVIFKQNPTMVAGTVAACLTIIGVYLILNSLNETRIKYE